MTKRSKEGQGSTPKVDLIPDHARGHRGGAAGHHHLDLVLGPRIPASTRRLVVAAIREALPDAAPDFVISTAARVPWWLQFQT